jgi:hypothetical protein
VEVTKVNFNFPVNVCFLTDGTLASLTYAASGNRNQGLYS